MNRNHDRNDNGRPARDAQRADLRDYTGVQRGAYGRYDEDDWQPRELRRDDAGYGDLSAERGLGRGRSWETQGGAAQSERQRGDYRDHYGRERGHGHDIGYHGSGDEGHAAHPGRYAGGAYGGYAEQTRGEPGSGAYGQPRGQPGEDFRGRGPKNYVRSDERLREDLNERLTVAPDIDASDIEVHVDAGRVRLSGQVDRRETRYRVEDLVSHCSGVHEIDNQLRVVGRGAARDGEAKT